MKAVITKEGDVAIPEELRRQMHLEPGQIVTWEQISASECRVRIEAPSGIVADPFAAIGFAQRHGLAPKPAGTTAEWMRLLREDEET